jgi:hypothetical protein
VVTCDLPVLLLTGRHQEAEVSRRFIATQTTTWSNRSDLSN